MFPFKLRKISLKISGMPRIYQFKWSL
jgi:hypothetical protein